MLRKALIDAPTPCVAVFSCIPANRQRVYDCITTNLPCELLHLKHSSLYAGLRVCVVVLDPLQQLAQAPVCIRLHVCGRR